MKKLIRAPGILAFVIITAIIYFCLTPLLRLSLIELGEAVFDAKVDIHQVVIDFSASKLVIEQVSIGDKDAPMTNLFEFKTATVDIALLKMFQGQVIIDNLSINGLKFSTQRKNSAALSRKTFSKKDERAKIKKEAKSEAIKEKLKQSLPSADEILARESLQTDAAYGALSTYYNTQKIQWDALQKDLPTKKRVDQYEQELKVIVEGKIQSLADFNDKKKRLKKLKKSLNQDQETLKQAKALASENKKGLSLRLTTLKKAPKADLQQLKNKYQFNQGGALNITGLLFGSDIQSYSEQGLYWYKKVEPLLSGDDEEKSNQVIRSSGRFIHFGKQIEPDFWLKRASLSAEVGDGAYDITIQDLSHQQLRTGKPIIVDVLSTAVNNMRKLTVNAVIDYRSENKQERMSFVIEQYQLEAINVSKDSYLSIALIDSLVDVQGSINRVDGKVLGLVRAVVNNPQFITEAKNEFAKELGLAIEAVEKFTVDVEIKGVKKLSIDSDLDRQINRVVKSRLKAKQTEIEHELQAKLNEKMDAYLVDLNIDRRLTDGASLDPQLNQIENMLKSGLNNYQDQQKAKAKKRIRNKLKSKFKSLF